MYILAVLIDVTRECLHFITKNRQTSYFIQATLFKTQKISKEVDIQIFPSHIRRKTMLLFRKRTLITLLHQPPPTATETISLESGLTITHRRRKPSISNRWRRCWTMDYFTQVNRYIVASSWWFVRMMPLFLCWLPSSEYNHKKLKHHPMFIKHCILNLDVDKFKRKRIQDLTTFSPLLMEINSYEFIVMLKNTPTNFQRIMNNTLSWLIGSIVLVYLVDIIEFSSN